MSKDELIPAATVMMLRDTDDGPEVFMVVRHHEIDFAWAWFSGGKADPADFDEHALIAAALMIMMIRIGVAHCPIRESFEECGIAGARKRRKRFHIRRAAAGIEGWQTASIIAMPPCLNLPKRSPVCR